MAWIDALFQRMIKEKASDLHLSSGNKPMLRVDGSMGVIQDASEISAERMLEVLKEIAPARNWEEFEANSDTDFAYELPNLSRFRVNFFRDLTGPGGVFRQIPNVIPTAEQLGLPPVVLDLCQLTKGLVLITGPTGSGKSTTLAAMVDHCNSSRDDHIITIEDPVEFVHENRRCLINQREVGRHTGSFKKALRAALREDPDIVLVGEMRDLETVAIAIETAETGHLVFGTVHTTTAASTVDRIIDQFPSDQQAQIRVMLADSLKGVLSQTLCKRMDRGRVAALEIMMVTPAIASNIREGKTHQIASMMQMGRKYGMQMLNDSLLEHVSNGLVDPTEAYRRAVMKEDMVRKLQDIGMSVSTSAVELSEATPAQAPAPAASAPRPPLPSSPHSAQPAQPAPASAPRGPGYVDPFEQFKRRKA